MDILTSLHNGTVASQRSAKVAVESFFSRAQIKNDTKALGSFQQKLPLSFWNFLYDPIGLF